MADKPAPVEKHEPPKELESRATVQKYMGRAKRSPVEQAEFFYNVKKTHILFFVTSLLMLISFILMFEKDHNREWKPYQIQFENMKFEKLLSELREAEAELRPHQQKVDAVDKQIEVFLRQFEKPRKLDIGLFPHLAAELGRLQELFPEYLVKDKETWGFVQAQVEDWEKQKLSLVEQESIRGDHYDAMQLFNFAKDTLAAVRFQYEEAKHHWEEAEKRGDLKVTKYKDHYDDVAVQWEEANAEVTRRKLKADQFDRLKEFYAEYVAALESRPVPGVWGGQAGQMPLEDMKKERDRLAKKVDDMITRLVKERPSFAKEIRNKPMSDFFKPDYRVVQVALPDIQEKVDFLISTKVGRVDRCHTCHVGITDPTYKVFKRPEEEYEVDQYVFQNDFLKKYVDHAVGTRRPPGGERKPFGEGDCEVCATKERSEWNKGRPGEPKKHMPALPLTQHGDWSEDDAVKFTKAFMAHPRLDLYAADGSAHEMKTFGCTICHEGDGRDTTFTRVVHTPDTFKEGQDWRRRHGTPYGEEHYNWGYRELWDFPMTRTKFMQNSCRKCHEQEVEIDGGGKYVEGMKLFERAGCYACHKTNTYPVLDKHLEGAANIGGGKVRRPGPPLKRISTKVTKEWAMKWIRGPRDFRPTARMPHFFGQSNTRDTVDGKKYPVDEKDGHRFSPIEDTVVAAIVEYLWKHSAKDADPAPPANLKGDATRGKSLVDQVGCCACHQTTEKPLEAFDPVNGPSRYLEEWGPNLAGVGSKMNRAWLYTWVRDPKKHFKRSRMPDLRLSEQEAVDVVEYLMTLRKPEWEKVPAGKPSEEIVKGLILEQIKKRNPDRYAELEYENIKAGKDPRGTPLEWLGEKMVRQYGCYSCHGLNDEKFNTWSGDEGIGVEFTGSQPWGNKHHDRLDFGFASDDLVNHHGVTFPHQFTDERVDMDLYGHRGEGVHVPHTREHFLEAKLTNPRVFDGGKMASKPWDELLRMPNFAFTPYEIERLQTFVLSFTEHKVNGFVSEMQREMTGDERALQRGEWVARQSNCLECHRLQLDGFEVEWTREEGGKEVTTWEFVEGRKRLERSFDQAIGSFKDWALGDENTPDVLKKKMKLWSVAWAADHRTLLMPKAITPANQFVAFDGDRWWYLDKDKDGKETRRRIRRHIPARGGTVIPWIDASKDQINKAHAAYLAKVEADLEKAEEDLENEDDPKKEAALEKLIEKLEEILDTSPEFLIPKDQMEARYPPMLRTQGVKTQSDWLFEFLKNPHPIRPNMAPIVKGGVSVIDIGIRMPTFGFTDEEATALVRWFAVRDHLDGVDVYPHTAFPERDPAFLAKRKELHLKAAQVLSDRSTGCLTCHYVGGEAPRGGPDAAYKFGPELAKVADRLRPRWLYEWVANPASIYPGTVMTQYDFSVLFPPPPTPEKRRDGSDAAVEVLLNWEHFYQGK